ncbi:phage late control D family protein [Clostridium lundense]|uniref:phage late control D family protein n=1 Tax=Clostridium lundense TaxID=319475 RepID=UPI000A4C7638|nr:hypothetical protein [Clostridium lundense]
MEPRAIIEVDGADVRWNDFTNLSVENTVYLAADSFDCTLNNNLMLSDWLRKNQEVRIYIGYVKDIHSWNKSQLKHIFTGRIDGVKPNFDSSKTVKIIGRDYSAPMIDTEYSVSYNDVTSSDVASILAKKYGLTPIVTATDNKVDREMWVNKKEWEVIQGLADMEGFVCYVTKDKELYFGERNDSDENIIDSFIYTQGLKSNCKIEFDDSSIDVINKVTVRHWIHDRKQLIEASSQNDFLINQMGQTKERIEYVAKAKTNQAAKEYADKLLKEYSRQVITGNGTRFPGNPGLYAEGKINAINFGRFSGTYYINKVVHQMSKNEGYINSFDITNIRPDDAQQYRSDLYENNGKKY